MSDKKTERIEIRLTENQRRILQDRADRRGVSISAAALVAMRLEDSGEAEKDGRRRKR